MENNRLKRYGWPIIIAFLTGISIALVNPGERPVLGFLSGFLLTLISLTLLGRSWKKLDGSRQVTWALALAFITRIFIGIILFVSLPVFGYDEAPSNNGYLYLDAYQRDTDAWQLAESDQSLTSAFKDEFYSDQYGGLLSLSAGIYRFLSPDSHRPLLIVIVISFLYAFGLPYFWRAVKDCWGDHIALICAWIYALYPETIILGASQMREPILIGLSAIGFWAINLLPKQKKQAIWVLGLCTLGLIFISYKAAAAILIGLALYFWIAIFLPQSKKNARTASYFIIAILILTGVYLSWNWLIDSSKWDLLLMESSSGRIQWELELIGEKYRAPFIIAYGVLQPVLPATIIYPGIPITKVISIFRAIGWYTLLPFLFTAVTLVWKTKPKLRKYLITLMLLIVLSWTLISSARAGGDQWDNPRYRSIFLIWYAVLAAWAWVETKTRASRWLRRIIFLEIIYSGFFIHWYLSRYYGLFRRMDFWPMIRLLIGIGAISIVGGIIVDWIRKKKTDPAS